MANATVLLTTRQWDFHRTLSAIPASRVQSMRDTIARHAHTMCYREQGREDGRQHEGIEHDAFEIAHWHSYRRATSPDVQAAGHEMQRSAGVERGRQIAEFDAFARAASQGICLGHTTGSWSAQSCARTTPTPDTKLWEAPPRPLISKSATAGECLERCRGCARCGLLAFSLISKQCMWSPFDYIPCYNSSQLERRWEFWQVYTVTLRGPNGEFQDHSL